jgi:hypothetical protein
MELNDNNATQSKGKAAAEKENLKIHKIRFANNWRTVLPLKFLSSKIMY